MVSAVEELEKVSDLCARLDLSPQEPDLAASLLEPIAGFLGAETASFRSLSVSNGAPKPNAVVSLGIPHSVDDAYLTRYFKLDPARRLLGRRLTKPLFAHPTKYGEWSKEQETPAMLRQYREEFLQYRKEFLLPNNFYHHVGFCFQDLVGHTLLFDFHRVAASPAFGRLRSLGRTSLQCSSMPRQRSAITQMSCLARRSWTTASPRASSKWPRP